jgi:hypothetical protein
MSFASCAEKQPRRGDRWRPGCPGRSGERHQYWSGSTVETALGQRWQSLLRAHHRHSSMAGHALAPRSAREFAVAPHVRHSAELPTILKAAARTGDAEHPDAGGFADRPLDMVSEKVIPGAFTMCSLDDAVFVWIVQTAGEHRFDLRLRRRNSMARRRMQGVATATATPASAAQS